MCLLTLAWRWHQRYPLVFVGNRDEFYARPTQAAHWWPGTNPRGRMLGGRDLEAGGTWLGLREDGLFATVTNVREPTARRAGERSRGALITSLLAPVEADADPLSPLTRLREEGDCYAHYNLLAGTLGADSQLLYANNVDDESRPLAPGLYALSNHRLDTPWPKALRTRKGLGTILDETHDEPAIVDALMQLMADRSTAAVEDLPPTGLAPERELALSSPFIHTQGYGTRATTVILARDDGRVRFIEQSFDALGKPNGRVDESFTLVSPF
ncbi:MAG: NRDE family protein [Pseudomonadota bacterium]